ncbi:threonine/homoserine/homoserine lactone efflux protein [Actinoalloteichus hoggarensis]|uniref:Threonine efflux protein n=1 Tax=Actinoalloteichus hoggarensis TaxID=1470176 RepID=A0A221W196_9PSEU|nr:LysE family translocator [Actinoalloteichus hoggarensis]ASO19549.1 Threonine efflux protein [Actinoalloteichus hoggarensis]MBB5919744.1 threonine/homoserine/homoserine lactone efflux protein [Actinoalloteichus hoggarensis]
MPEGISLFIAITAITIVVPGPDFVLVTRNTLLFGRRAGYLTAAGISLSLTLYSLLAVVGLTTLIATHEGMLTTLRLAGGGYLVFLGWQGLRSWWRGRAARRGPCDLDAGSVAALHPSDVDESARPRTGGLLAAPLAQGALNNLLNPKALVFYLTLLPQFIQPGGSVVAQTGLLGGIATGLAALWWLLYVTAVGRLAPALRRRSVRDGLDLGSGLLLGGFGVVLAVGVL